MFNFSTSSTQRTSVHTGDGLDHEWSHMVDELSRLGFLDVVGAAPALLDVAAGIRADRDNTANGSHR